MKDNIKPISQLIHFIIPTDSSHDKMRKSKHLLTNITPQLEEKGAANIVTKINGFNTSHLAKFFGVYAPFLFDIS